jgi:hypothetical protein
MTTTTAKRFNKDGIEIADVGPLKDGERRSFPMSMMDHALVQQVEDKFAPDVDTSFVRHQPGYLVPAMTDAELVNSAAAQEARKKALSEAWKSPPPKPAVAPFKKDELPAIGSTTPAVPDVAAALLARDARLQSAWKRGAA